MVYIAMYLGIICGHILRVTKIYKRKNKHSNDNIVCFAIRIKVTIVNIWKSISYTLKKIVYTIQITFYKIKIKVTTSIKSCWDNIKKRLLANTNIYIWLKVAKVYSVPGRRVVLLSYNSMRKYCEAHNEKYIVIERRQERPVCMPEFFELTDELVVTYKSPEIYIAQIHSAEICGASSIIIAEKECLYDPFLEDTDGRLDVKFSNAIGNIKEKIIVERAPIERKISSGIFLMGFASYNYYHLTVEIMSRLRYVEQFDEYLKLPLIVDQVMLDVPQYKEMLDKFNIHKHPVVFVKPGEVIEVENLIYPSYNTWMPINVKEREMIRASDFLIAKSALENIRSYVNMESEKNLKQIFISRENLTATRLKNEAEIVTLFEKYGFDIVHTEKLSYLEQVELFHKAKRVVATSGAALTNIIYCQPGTEVICIIPEEDKFYMYSTIAYLLELKPIFLNAKIIEKSIYPAADIFEISKEYCERFLKKHMCNGDVLISG